MVIGGIWHGAGWGFVIRGLAHGLKGLPSTAGMPERTAAPAALRRLAAHFLFVTFAWILFRSASLEGAAAHLHAMVNPASALLDSYRPFLDVAPLNRMMALVVIAGLIAFLAPPAAFIAGVTIMPNRKSRSGGALLRPALRLAVISFTGQTSSNEFIYSASDRRARNRRR